MSKNKWEKRSGGFSGVEGVSGTVERTDSAEPGLGTSEGGQEYAEDSVVLPDVEAGRKMVDVLPPAVVPAPVVSPVVASAAPKTVSHVHAHPNTNRILQGKPPHVRKYLAGK